MSAPLDIASDGPTQVWSINLPDQRIAKWTTR
jgi:hypothetical protein